MKQDAIALTLEARTITGKSVKKLRREGIVPAVIHNHGKDSLHVQADGQALLKTFHQAGKHNPVQLAADGKKFTAMIKTAEFDPKKQQLRHVVFNAVAANQKVDAEIPVQPKYDEGNEVSPAERNSLLVINNLEVVTVKALPADLPSALYYNGETLVEAGDNATVADLIVPKNIEIETDSEQVIATVYEPSAVAAANDAIAGDAAAEDAQDVESEYQSNAEEGTQAPEQRPGGKKEFEDKEQGRNPEKQ